MDNKNLPAFPISINKDDPYKGVGKYDCLSKREWFAGMILAGQMAHIDNAPTTDFEGAAKYCVKMVDAILAELDKQPAPDMQNGQ